MKGLLKKEWYMTVKYCKAFLVLCVLFIGMSLLMPGNLFFVFYPSLFVSMLPVTLLAYDERSKWNRYCGTLPYSKAQLVSAKYLIGLFALLAVFVLTAIAQATMVDWSSPDSIKACAMILELMLSLALLATALVLPFVFKLGVEKGRIAYLIMIGLVCGGSVLLSALFDEASLSRLSWGGTPMMVFAVSILIYALSWYLSIRFYEKRELS